ncbi:MAG: alpha/beta hydrolase [Opitutales bacterium]|nr:alpha/beta hydrolase [Opitutales bacterium]
MAKPKLHKYSLSKIFKEIYVSEKNTKPETPNNINIVKDIEYSDVSNRTLDLFLPKDKKISHPCVILFHGGGWISGKKTNMQPMAEYLASVGYAVVNVEYALKKQFNEALRDQFRVLKWIENNADKYKINLDKIATCGGSSGGVMAMQLATIANNIDAFNKTINKTDLKPKSVKPISACITMASGHDMTHPRRFNKMFACDTPKARNYSSYTYLSKNNPPTLLTHGMFDNVVTSSETLKISEALQQNGIETQVILCNTKIHAYWQLNGGKLMQKVWTDVQNFLDKTFKQ